jgi:protein-S-isoprenylcysteine O-methyltransferase Ste14
MATAAPAPAPTRARPARRGGARAALLGPIVLLVLGFDAGCGALVFALAGTIYLPWFWAALGLFAALHVASAAVVLRQDPSLVAERLRPGPGVPLWDRLIVAALAALFAASLATAALDAGRLHVANTIPVVLRVVGLAGIVAGFLLVGSAVAANRWYSRAVRIQRDRGQEVVRDGPYRSVRHPGYLGWIVFWLSLELALGSWIALGISVVAVALIVTRTALEDRFLRRGLEGYEDYARTVRWRLVPGVW